MLCIAVSGLSGKSLQLDDIGGDTEVRALKAIIADKWNVPSEFQKLVYQESEWPDSDLLSDHITTNLADGHSLPITMLVSLESALAALGGTNLMECEEVLESLEALGGNAAIDVVTTTINKRVAEDGHQYTRQEFIEFFGDEGGIWKWHYDAEIVPITHLALPALCRMAPHGNDHWKAILASIGQMDCKHKGVRQAAVEAVATLAAPDNLTTTSGNILAVSTISELLKNHQSHHPDYIFCTAFQALFEVACDQQAIYDVIDFQDELSLRCLLDVVEEGLEKGRELACGIISTTLFEGEDSVRSKMLAKLSSTMSPGSVAAGSKEIVSSLFLAIIDEDDERIIPFILKALSVVSLKAVFAPEITESGDFLETVLDHLVCCHGTELVRRTAADAIFKLLWEDAQASIEPLSKVARRQWRHPARQKTLLEVLARLGEGNDNRVMEIVLKGLKCGKEDVMLAAVRACPRVVGSPTHHDDLPQCVYALVDVLMHEHEHLRWAAVEALLQLDVGYAPLVAAEIEQALAEKNSTAAAWTALSQLTPLKNSTAAAWTALSQLTPLIPDAENDSEGDEGE